jgi:hypothetical protein
MMQRIFGVSSLLKLVLERQRREAAMGGAIRRGGHGPLRRPGLHLREGAREWALELTGEEKELLVKRYTRDPQAYELYLKGRFLSSQAKQDRSREPSGSLKKRFERTRTMRSRMPGSLTAMTGCLFRATCHRVIRFREHLLKGGYDVHNG